MPQLTRRSALLGLTAAFSLGRASLALAAAPTEQRLVVVILRGALDGLAAVPPYGDANLLAWRGELLPAPVGQPGGMLDLGGFFAMHPALAGMAGLYRDGDLAVLHAVVGPTRSRSHFEAQDCLESGADHRLTSGWLNRAIAALPHGSPASQALAMGVSVPLLLRGPAAVGAWAPQDLPPPTPDLYARVAEMNHDDPLLGPALAEALRERGFATHALGAAAFDPAIVSALPGTITEITRDGPGMTDAMFRILADWMRGTELVTPTRQLSQGPLVIGGRHLRLMALSGHSASDLAVLDEATGTLLAGDLVFHNRAPATPDADLAKWHAALATLEATEHKLLLPGHGPADTTGAAIAQTRDWLTWMHAALSDAAAHGLDMAEAGEVAIPSRFADVAAARYELQRSVSHFYPAIEAAQLPRIDQ